MAFTNSDVVFTTLFTPAADRLSGTVTITDTSALVAAGISLADVSFAVNGWSPDGVYWKTGNLTTPDVADESVTRAFTFTLPLGLDGFVQEGDYQFQLLLRVAGAVDPGDYNSAKVTVPFCIDTPTPAIDVDVDCLCAIITGTNATDLTGWTTVSESLTYRYPGVGLHANIVGGSSVTTAGESIYTGTGAMQLLWTGTKDNVLGSIDYTVEVKSNCDFDLCELECCIEAVYQRVLNARNQLVKEEAQTIMRDVVVLMVMIRQAAECGRTEQVSTYVDRVRAITNCTAGCGCASDTPTRIVPICTPGGGEAVIVQGDGSYTYTTLVGSTYTVYLTQAQRDILDNTYNTAITSTGGSIAVTNSIDNTTTPPTHTTNVEVVAGDVPPDWMQTILTLTFTGTGGSPGTPSAALTTPKIVGTKFQSPTIDFVTGFPNSMRIRGFHTGTPGNSIVRADILEVNYNDINTSGTNLQAYIGPMIPLVCLPGDQRFLLNQFFPAPAGGSDSWQRWDFILDYVKIALTFTEPS